jgi:cytoskeletal protein CcmA (bactofilin family)
MLRIGKNPKDQEDQEHSTDRQDAGSYTTPRTYSSYQSTETKAAGETTTPTPQKAMTESETLAKDIKEGTLSGFVGSGTLVTGEATFKAMLRVDGHLSGRISSSSGTLIVGANGKVDANIDVAIAIIHGTINGDIIASQRLELGRAAKVNGNIQTPSLVIEQGGIFEGSCKMIQMNADKTKNEKKASEDKPLETAGMKPNGADVPKPAETAKPAEPAKPGEAPRPPHVAGLSRP